MVSFSNKGKAKVIVSGHDHILKPEPEGKEVAFYEKISTSSDPELKQFRDLAPQFHGLETVTKEDGTTSQYLKLGISKIVLYFILTISFRKLVRRDDKAMSYGHQNWKYQIQFHL